MKYAIAICALALCLLWASDSGAGDWPMWGGAGDRNANRAAVAWTQKHAGNDMPTPLLHDGLS